MNGLPPFRGVRAALGHGRLLVVLVATVVFTTLAGAAFGYWGATGSGTGSASTGTLNQPTGVKVSSAAGSGSVSVIWIAPSGTPSAQSYSVTRTGNGTSTVACPTSGSTLKATSCTDSSVPDGTYTYTVTAVYNSWTATSDPSASVAVTNTIATTTTLKSSSTPSSVVGQQVTYTATVAAASGSATPTGSVTFKEGTNTISCAGGTQALSGGVATCSVTYTAAGDHSITATYGGSTAYSGSTTSTALIQSISKADTTTTVTSSGNPSVANQAVTFTATASAKAPGAGTPTGTVTFTDGGNPLTCSGGNQTLNAAATATCQVTFATAGARSIAASYSGDSNYTTSTGTLGQNVNAVGTTTAVGSTQNPAKSGTTITYTAVVKDGSGSAATTGTVSFSDNGTAISACNATPVDAQGRAACAQMYSDKGSHSIVAVYSGGGAYAGSTSAPLSQRIVNGQVAGLGFANVTVDNVAVTPICSGTIGTTTYICTVSGGNNAVLAASSTFVNSTGVLASYSADDQTVNAAVTGKSPGNSSVTMPGNGTTSTAKATVTKNGSNSSTITITFSDGVSSFTAQLKIN